MMSLSPKRPRRRRRGPVHGRGVLLVAGLVLASGCQRPAAEDPRTVGPAVLELRLAPRFGTLQRPPVEYDHGRHVKRLGASSCKTCHKVDAQGGLVPKFARLTDGASRDKLMTLYHDQCLGCHRKRAEGPRGCGGCHAKRPRTRSTRLAMAFDYALHFRHTRALGDQKSCEGCHHVFDEATRRLVYEKGTESSCRDCHGARDDGRNLSLRNAAHRDCVSCHLKRRDARQQTGPVECAGCHGAGERAAIHAKAKGLKVERLKLEYSARLKRRQPDRTWMHTPGGKAPLVGFDHQAHEPRARFCTSCHHESLAACKSCHTLTGQKKGGFVTLATAYHETKAKQSCVGCHRAETRKRDCAGCHFSVSGLPRQRSCNVCHRGAHPDALVAGAKPAPFPAPTALAPLPAYSTLEYPEHVTIKALAKRYQPSKMPHGLIVGKLDRLVRGSKLAAQFHGEMRMTCAGCHHHAPVGKRPAACSSCHGVKGHATKDQPGLQAAYHRQCMGCHRAMGLEKLNTCTGCHHPATSGRGGGR